MQDAEEAAAAEGGEAVSSGGVAGASVNDVVVPADEVRLQGLVDDRVGVFDAAEGLVGEDDAEAEGVVGGVALVDGDLTDGVEALEEGGGVGRRGLIAARRGWPVLAGGCGFVVVARARSQARCSTRPRAPRVGSTALGRAHPVYLPCHFGGRFSVKAAWNSA
ncbi:hypothetical protein SVIOM342S_04643 [Streptomyces violaceorubidus]